ncbi:transposase, partial [Clostridium haemolyticum]
MIYGVNNSIFSLRELEYKIKQDIVFQKIIGLKEVPDHSTFSLRAIALEKYVYYGIYAMLI